jgi:hypothetical protein
MDFKIFMLAKSILCHKYMQFLQNMRPPFSNIDLIDFIIFILAKLYLCHYISLNMQTSYIYKWKEHAFWINSKIGIC